MYRLILNAGTAEAQEIPLKAGTNYLGRGFANDFRFDDASISTTHCQVIVDGDSVCIRDSGSTNGTFLGGVQIHEAFVQPGQTIRLGSVEMTLESGEADEALAAVLEPAMAMADTGAEYDAAAMTGAAPMTHAVSPAQGAPAVAEEAAPVFCKNHYKNAARHKCPKCQRHFCDLCVNTRGSAAGGLKFCKVCSSQCLPVSVAAHAPKPINYFRSVPQAFRYPFVGNGPILLIGGTFFFGILDAANFISRYAAAYGMRAMTIRAVIITFVLGAGYLFSYLKNVIYSTANGDRQLPDWPELSEWHADIVSPMFQFVVISTLSFGPAIVFGIWFAEDYPWAVAPLVLLGCFYFPMGLLAVAMFDSLAALNPVFVTASILKIPREYSIAALVFAGILAARWLCETILKMIIPVPLVPTLLADLLGIYLLIVQTRILGLLYLSRKSDLGWFRR
jgi:hypothetical protein